MAMTIPDTAARPDVPGPGAPWVKVADAIELRGEGPHAVSAGDVDLVLLRTPAGLRVYEGLCPHQGALLGEGELDGDALVCRNHRWKFDVATGQRQGGPQCLRACPVKEEGGAILVDASGLSGAKARATGPLRAVQDLPGPKPLPLVGNAFEIDAAKAHIDLEDFSAKYGPIFALRLAKDWFVVVSDPALAEPLFRERPETFRRPTYLAEIMRELGISGVFSAEGEAWRSQRRLAMEALAQRHVRGFYPALARIGHRLLRRWDRAADEGRVLDPGDELKRYTVDATVLLVFGHDLNTLEDRDDVVQRHLELVFPTLNRRMNALFPYWRILRLPADRRVDRAIAEIYGWLADLVARARARLANPAAKPANFIEIMVAARDGEGRGFSDEIIFGNALTMLLGGEDTTAYTLAWAMHELLDHPAATAALRAEADAALGEDAFPVEVEQTNRLTYALAVANETMRLRPIAPIPIFEPTRDVVVGDVAVPKGVTIIVASRLATRDPARFGTPLAFLPERWLEAEPNGRPHDPTVSLPFGSGPRICPGRSLALTEMRHLLAAIYKRYDIERVGARGDVRELMAFSMTPKNLHVRLRRRPH